MTNQGHRAGMAAWMRWAGRLSRLLRAVYVAVALLGALVTPPVVALVVVPAAALSAFALTSLGLWYLEQHWPARRLPAVAALVAAGAVPFFRGVTLLSGVGVVLVYVLIAVVTVLLLARMRLLALAPDAAPGEAGGDASLRELLCVLPLETVFVEWRAVQRQLETGDDVDPVLAQARLLILKELARRDPAGCRSWLAQGAAGPPESFIGDPGLAA